MVEQPGGLGAETALVHVLDRNFLQPLKVLHHSLHAQGSLRGCPVVVVTDDPVVAEDRYLRRVAHDIELVGPEDLKAFAAIRGERIKPDLATGFAPKYTFLKLLFFKPRGFRRHIFIDADMLCLNPLDEALLAAPFAAKAVQEFGASVFPTASEKPPPGFRDRAMAYVGERSAPLETGIKGINSGFMVAQDEIFAHDILGIALELAAAKAFGDEQSLTTAAIARSGVSHLRLPLWYNARRRMFASLGEEFFAAHRAAVKLLHYTPGKPWKMAEGALRSWDRLWFEQKRLAREWIDDLEGSMV